MDKPLQKAMNLAKKTGDRVIVVDTARSEETFIIMGIDEYEKLVIGYSEVRNLTEDELLDKINRDIAIWKSDNDINNKYKNEDKNVYKRNTIEDDYLPDNDIDDVLDENMYYYNEENVSFNDEGKKEGGRERGWAIPPNIKKGAEEIINN